MQPRVIMMSTICLLVYAIVVRAASIHPINTQYSPLTLQNRQYGVYGKVKDQLNKKDQNLPRNFPFIEHEEPYESNYLGSDTLLHRSESNSDDNPSPLVEDKQLDDFFFDNVEFADEKKDGSDAEELELASREPSPPSKLDNPFVSDDTFHDQVSDFKNIRKLNPFLEKLPLDSTSIARLPSNGKSKTSKKIQTPEYNDNSTEIPPNIDPFSIGGVPELQVGCEGLEASDLNVKQKRSIESIYRRDKKGEEVSQMPLDLSYDIHSEERGEKVQREELGTIVNGVEQNGVDFNEDNGRPDELPVREDLNNSGVDNE
ncbi:uncharacterized protein LOC143428136 [Xylocopa sonorina]|uniref:uncharacterized protein LOC143428136 n=1 Tax=Xylocopa sonorina TaxID=1818115 RepID=UPI00403AF75E